MKYQSAVSENSEDKNKNHLYFNSRKILSACACLAVFGLSVFGLGRMLYPQKNFNDRREFRSLNRKADTQGYQKNRFFYADMGGEYYISLYLSFFTNRAIPAENADTDTLYSCTFSKTDTAKAVDTAEKIADILNRKIVNQNFFVTETDENGQMFTRVKSISDLGGETPDSGVFFFDDGKIDMDLKNNKLSLSLYEYTISRDSTLKESLYKDFSALSGSSIPLRQINCHEKDALSCIFYMDSHIDGRLLNSVTVSALPEEGDNYSLYVTRPLSGYQKLTRYSPLPLQTALDIFGGKEFAWAQDKEIDVQLMYMPVNSVNEGMVLMPFYRFCPQSHEGETLEQYFLPAVVISEN